MRQALLDGIRRVAAAEAMAAGAPVPPEVTVVESTPGVVNDVPLTGRLRGAFSAALGAASVDRLSAGERQRGLLATTVARACRRRCSGSAWRTPAALAEAKAAGKALPPLHSAEFCPDYAPSIRTGVTALVSAALELLPAR